MKLKPAQIFIQPCGHICVYTDVKAKTVIIRQANLSWCPYKCNMGPEVGYMTKISPCRCRTHKKEFYGDKQLPS